MFDERQTDDQGRIENQSPLAAQRGVAGAGQAGAAMIGSGSVIIGATGAFISAASVKSPVGFAVGCLKGMAYILSEATAIARNGHNSQEEHNGYDFVEQGWSHIPGGRHGFSCLSKDGLSYSCLVECVNRQVAVE